MSSERFARLRVAFVPGVTPDKWARLWAERMPRVRLELSPVDETSQTAVLYDGRADMCFVRLPVHTEDLHVIPLYREVPVVVVPRGHFVEAADEVTVADLADERLLQNPDDVPGWRKVSTALPDGSWTAAPPLTVEDAVATVAAGLGVVILPLSVARLHHRKDVVHRPVVDVAPSRVGLAWRVTDAGDERVEAFIGIVRGRRANSSRGTAPNGASPTPRTGQPVTARPRRRQGVGRSATPRGKRRGRR